MVCLLFMLVVAEKKNMGWRNDMLGPGKKRWLTPAMNTVIEKYFLNIVLDSYNHKI